MQTTTIEATSNNQATYPQCIKESKSSNRIQALSWLLIGVVLFAIYNRQPDKDTTLSLIQISLVAFSGILAIYKFFSCSKLTYIPTGSIVKKEEYSFNKSLLPDIRCCLEEGNMARLKALKNDDAGGLLVEVLESQDHLYLAARLLKYEPHGYVAITEWKTMKR